jgi:hypothetical protein
MKTEWRLLEYYMRIIIGSLYLNNGLEKIAWGRKKMELQKPANDCLEFPQHTVSHLT